MPAWLSRTTRFEKVALCLLAIALARLAFTINGDDPSYGLLVLALVTSFFAFYRHLLWRVRNRLLVTYFLFGVVPVLLIGLLLFFCAQLILAGVVVDSARRDLNARIGAVYSAAQDLARAAARGAAPELWDDIRQRMPGLQCSIRRTGKVVLEQGGPSFPAAAASVDPGYRDLFSWNGEFYIAARSVVDSGGDALVYLLLDEQILASLSPGVAAMHGVSGKDANIDVHFGGSGGRITVGTGASRKEYKVPLAEEKGWWDKPIVSLLTQDARTPSGETENIVFPLLSRFSQLNADLVSGRVAGVIFAVLAIIGGFLLIIEMISLIWSVSLTRTITRSVHDLYLGTLQVASGDFSHQIPVRGRHQLSDLAKSFNGMIAQIQHFIGEMRKKQKLESELEIARHVQNRLFPRAVPELKTLELAGVCIPGRFVSGDYYDYFLLDSHSTAIALGDVSGKGVSAALLMASIQSALHAQLKFTDAPHPSLSTATLMALISQQLYESTPAEKYATFFCSVYNDDTRVLRYTNAGHLKPIMIRDGKANVLEGDGLVAGLLPKVSYEQQEFQSQPGDLIAIFSDGIPEAENAAAEEFGEPRLAELLVANRERPLEEIIQIVVKSVAEWAHDPDARDDTTLVLARGL
ncbi:MAG TPA: SpoIIE family protein phosphatase [Bryobacteraceae bacterium]|nr:SpoIIE family protein phosphatase [Bryobacteraceae bacterium]